MRGFYVSPLFCFSEILAGGGSLVFGYKKGNKSDDSLLFKDNFNA